MISQKCVLLLGFLLLDLIVQSQKIAPRPQRQQAAFGINAQFGAAVNNVQVTHGELADAVSG